MALLLILLWAGLAGWILLFGWLAYNSRHYLHLSEALDYPLQDSPSVSILVPARNEADMLPATLPAILDQDYANYEVILVDDGSTDDTPRIAEQFASRHPQRLRVIRVDQLPPGWVGKTHALHTALEAARGEWILATDADIVFHPKALRAGLWVAAQQRAALVSIYSFLECVTFWEKVMLPGFGLLLSAFFPVGRINDPRSSVALASGGYILMPRRMWQSLGGYEAIRSEMIDDMNTARRVKRSGNRIFVASTRDLLRTRMYYNLGEIWEGLRKNAFAGHGFSIPKLLATAVAYLIGNLLPLACLVAAAVAPAWSREPLGRSALFLALAQYGVAALTHLPLLFYLRIQWSYALLAPLGALLYAAICLDSMARTLLGRGVSWKTRSYSYPSSRSSSPP
jgi:hopene-associated glycosyltransferase HpnB